MALTDAGIDSREMFRRRSIGTLTVVRIFILHTLVV